MVTGCAAVRRSLCVLRFTEALSASVPIGAVVFVLLLVLQYATQPMSYAMETRPFAYFLVGAWITAVPLAALSLGATLLAKVQSSV
jgi:hypothetical protein